MASFAALVASGFLSVSCWLMSIPVMESWLCAGADGGFCDCCAGDDATTKAAAAASNTNANFLSMITPIILRMIWLTILQLLLMIRFRGRKISREVHCDANELRCQAGT